MIKVTLKRRNFDKFLDANQWDLFEAHFPNYKAAFLIVQKWNQNTAGWYYVICDSKLVECDPEKFHLDVMANRHLWM